MRCIGMHWEPCDNKAVKGRTYCKKHLKEHEKELDNLTAMASMGWPDQYGRD